MRSQTRPARDDIPSAIVSRSGIALRPGDVIRIEGVPDAGEPAALDYVEIALDARFW
jgi:hypothetical protein